ncbi:MAG: serine/threonine-protein phosphatase [Brooklawnia sp.]|nr:serine/threonine-protein phosphatase [Brooklawnia sp.]
MSDQSTSQPVPEPAAAPIESTTWAQPPAASDRAAGWVQPTAGTARRLYGSTEAKQWQPSPVLAARAEREAAAAPVAGAQAPGPAANLAPVRTFTPTVQSCPRCGGSIDFDGYCETCGAKAPSVREHFEESPANWVAGVCDRGIRHPRNEDALALDSTPDIGGRAVLVVCDGVSMSADSDVASLAAARAAVGYLASRADWNWDLAALEPGSVTRRLLTDAAQVANAAVLDNSDLFEASPASCTLAMGLVSGRRLLAATLGDSRVYWLPDDGAALLLSTDDSVAQEQIRAGMEREAAETGIHGHVITKWLGRDAPEIDPNVAGALAEGPGWLLVCSDGLWNYASDPALMSRLVSHFSGVDADPLRLARALVGWANEQGGHDNITVALARVDRSADATPLGPPEPLGYEIDIPTARTRPVASGGPNPTG